MAEVNNAAIENHDPALLASWRRFLDYDHVSSNQKRLYVRLRELVIALGLLTSAGAVVSIYLQQLSTTEWNKIPMLNSLFGNSSGLLRIFLIIMPIASVAVMRFAAQFASGTSWIEYRVGAETLRSHMYLYRTKAGEYKDLEDVAARLKLLDAVAAADSRIDELSVSVPYRRNYDKLLETIKSKTENEHDDGLTPLTVEQYIDWRVKSQVSWYINKVQSDYSKLKWEQILVLVVSGLGAVLSGINFEAVVAITTAMGIALIARSETRMYGATYGIFHWTSGKLQHHLYMWEVLSDEAKKIKDNQIEFVTAIENLFKQERELWRSQAMQSQSDSDNTINNQLQKEVSIKETGDGATVKIPVYNVVAQADKSIAPEPFTPILEAEGLSAQTNSNGHTHAEAATPDATAPHTVTTDAGTVMADALIEIAESGTPAQEDTSQTDDAESEGDTVAELEIMENAEDTALLQPQDTEDSKDLAG